MKKDTYKTTTLGKTLEEHQGQIKFLEDKLNQVISVLQVLNNKIEELSSENKELRDEVKSLKQLTEDQQKQIYEFVKRLEEKNKPEENDYTIIANNSNIPENNSQGSQEYNSFAYKNNHEIQEIFTFAEHVKYQEQLGDSQETLPKH